MNLGLVVNGRPRFWLADLYCYKRPRCTVTRSRDRHVSLSELIADLSVKRNWIPHALFFNVVCKQGRREFIEVVNLKNLCALVIESFQSRSIVQMFRSRAYFETAFHFYTLQIPCSESLFMYTTWGLLGLSGPGEPDSRWHVCWTSQSWHEEFFISSELDPSLLAMSVKFSTWAKMIPPTFAAYFSRTDGNQLFPDVRGFIRHFVNRTKGQKVTSKHCQSSSFSFLSFYFLFLD